MLFEFVMTHSKIIVYLCLLQILSACSSQTQALTKYRSSFDFSAITSYSIYDRNSKFSDFQNISDAFRNRIELVIERVFDKKGYQYQPVEDADIVVTYHLVNMKNRELKQYNAGVRYCRWCLKAGEEESGKKHQAIQPGSLVLDLVNTKTKRSVWRSIYPLKIKNDDKSDEIQEKIVLAINVMMKQLPNNT